MALLSFVILRFIGMKKRTNKILAKKQDVPNTGHPVFLCSLLVSRSLFIGYAF